MLQITLAGDVCACANEKLRRGTNDMSILGILSRACCYSLHFSMWLPVWMVMLASWTGDFILYVVIYVISYHNHESRS